VLPVHDRNDPIGIAELAGHDQERLAASTYSSTASRRNSGGYGRDLKRQTLGPPSTGT